MVAAVASQFESDTIPLAVTDGLLVNSEILRNKLLNAVQQKELEIDPVKLVHEPAIGALRIAARALPNE